jgi:hypothetical protein
MEILGTGDAARWNAVLDASLQHDFHHLPQYHRVSEQRGEGRGHFFVYSEGPYTIGLPLLLRPVQPDQPGSWQDATSVYGYGGPVASHESFPEAVVRNFQRELAAALGERRVVTVFSRLHPLIAQHEILAGIGECPVNGTTLSIDLTVPDHEQRANYSKNCRVTLRKLRASGFTGLHDAEKRYLPEFVEVYRETMDRVGAHQSYFFDDSYFDLLTRELGSASQLFVALKDGAPVAATLCMLCKGIMQDHLGGTRTAFLKFSPDRLVVDTARAWAANAGARAYHLGGGVGAKEDSVFKYKLGFATRRHTFSTFRWVLLPDVYRELSASAARRNEANGMEAISDGYFPAYRCPARPR